MEAQLRTQATFSAALPQNLAAQLAGFDTLSLLTTVLQGGAAKWVADVLCHFKPSGAGQVDVRFTHIGRPKWLMISAILKN